jgi:hypothetical protein
MKERITEMAKETYISTDLFAAQRFNLGQQLANSNMNFDAEDSAVWFARELNYVKEGAYDVKYPELTALKYFPRKVHKNAGGVRTLTYYTQGRIGDARVIANYADDFPRVDITAKEQVAFVAGIGDSYGFSVQEMRETLYAGRRLDIMRAEQARYAIDRKLNTIAWAGSEKDKLYGVLSEQNGIPQLVLEEGASGEILWTSKTPDEIIADINRMQQKVSDATKGAEQPDTLLLPTATMIDLANRRIDGTATSVLTYIKENVPFIKTIEDANELNADSFETNIFSTIENPVGTALLYTNNERKLSIEITNEFYQSPVQFNNMEAKILCDLRTAGALVYYPLSALIVTGI